MIKVRFAPSPTGFLHIGGARTALFNWMYARAQGGQFMLRIEDTDMVRSTKEYEEEILNSMKWLGMDWDELEYQSKRFDVYKEYAEKLVESGKAYRDGEAILLKLTGEEVKLYDLIRGEVTFDTSNFTVREEEGVEKSDEPAKLKDEVLIKSDGSPAYSFCCVVDDALMEITHVIRGEDHISNTPKQILMYNALGFKPPKYAHLPLIMDASGGRMSKRHGAVAVTEYRKLGFLSEAIVNYLMLLGWSPGNNKEIIGLKEAVKSFSIKKVNKTAAVFDLTKLTWINQQYIKQAKNEDVVEALIPLLKEKNYIGDDFDRGWLTKIVALFKSRLPTLVDFFERAGFFFEEEVKWDEEGIAKLKETDRSNEFEMLVKRLTDLAEYTHDKIEVEFKSVLEEQGLKPGDMIAPMRLALTGSAVGPGMFEIMECLGKDKTVKRLRECYSKIN